VFGISPNPPMKVKTLFVTQREERRKGRKGEVDFMAILAE
jgi:hypothetical protein